MKIRTIRKFCMFLVGINLFQPLRLFLDSSKFIFERFKLSEDQFDTFVNRSNLLMSVFGGAGTVAICFYFMFLASKFGINHYNKLLTIVTNWVVLALDVLILIFFSVGGEIGYFKVFYWLVVISSFVYGVNQCFILIVDPPNSPFFLLGLSMSPLQVFLYQHIYVSTREVDPRKIVMGQLVISLVLSVLSVFFFNYSYGGSGLFNIVGITRIADFMLDNSANRLAGNHRKNERYKKFLNEEIVHKIKNLEYEIILRFNLKSSYNITNIIHKAKKGKGQDDYKIKNKATQSYDRAKKGEERESEEEEEKVHVGVKVTSLRYENMMHGLEIYRHEVEKDVKLSRIRGEVADIDVNLFHFKHADVYMKSNLILINVVTVQFTGNDEVSDDTSSSNSEHDSEDSGRRPSRKARRTHRSEELGAYEMNYYFFIVHDRMYQYKPAENEWVHPVELLMSLINLCRHSVENMHDQKGHMNFLASCFYDAKERLYTMHRKIWGIPDKSGEDYEEEEEEDDDDADLEDGRGHHNKDKKHDKHGEGRHSHVEPKEDLEEGPKRLTLKERRFDDKLRKKMVMLFLNNKMKYAMEGAVPSFILSVVTIASLFLSFPMMGIFDGLEKPNAQRAELVIKIVALVPTLFVCVVCTFAFLHHMSLQTTWGHKRNYIYASYLVYLGASIAVFVTKKKAGEGVLKNSAFVVIFSMLIYLSFQANIVVSFVSLMFQKSGKKDHLTLRYLENNVKTNVQLMAFNLSIYHLIRLVYLAIYRKYDNRFYKMMFYVL